MPITICNNGHARIIHESDNCPLCASEEKIAKLEDDKVQLEGTIEDLHNQVLELQAER